MRHTGGKYKVVIEDLELEEAKETAKKILEFAEEDKIPYSIHDCISVQDTEGKVIEE